MPSAPDGAGDPDATDLSIAAAGDLAADGKDGGDDGLPAGLVVVAALAALAVTGATMRAWRRRASPA
jgi:hypothetical protein